MPGTLDKRIDLIVNCLAAFSSVFVIVHLLGLFFIDAMVFFSILLSVFFIIEYLPDIVKPNLKPYQKIISILLMLIGIAPHIYLIPHIARIRVLFGAVWTTYDVIFGTMAIFSAMVWTKRRFGWGMPIIAMVFCIYVLFAHLLPPSLFGRAYFGYGRFISFLFSDTAMYGSLMSIAFRIIFLYMLFGAFLNASGAGEYMIDASLALAGKYRGGPAKVVVVSSALLGTVNGSAVANVATTGPITIPMMKRTGYSPEFAGAIEAAASTGGQLLPPIMGAAAFVMAEFMGVSYASIVLAALVPSLLYFLALFLQVDMIAAKNGLRGAPPEELPDKKNVFRKLYMFLPIVALIYFLLVARTTVSRAGLYAILAAIFISWLNKDTRMGPRKIFAALAQGAKDCVGLFAVIMLAGVIIGAVTGSGFATRFSSVVLSLADGSMIITAILTAAICIILGLGLPTTAAYIITAAIALPALIRTGVPPMSAHMFVLYYAVLANITPPISPAIFAGANIAGASPTKTSFEAVKLASVAYLIPFFFLFNPSLLIGEGNAIDTIQAILTAILGCFILAVTLQGVTFKGNRLPLTVRTIWVAATVGLLYPDRVANVIGLGLLIAGTFLLLWPKISTSR